MYFTCSAVFHTLGKCDCLLKRPSMSCDRKHFKYKDSSINAFPKRLYDKKNINFQSVTYSYRFLRRLECQIIYNYKFVYKATNCSYKTNCYTIIKIHI